MQLSEFVWTLRSSVKVVFNNFLLKDETDRSEIVATKGDYFSRTLPLNIKYKYYRFTLYLPTTSANIIPLNNNGNIIYFDQMYDITIFKMS